MYGSFTLGAGSQHTEYSHMKMDDLTIWHSVLTDNQVWQLYVNGVIVEYILDDYKHQDQVLPFLTIKRHIALHCEVPHLLVVAKVTQKQAPGNDYLFEWWHKWLSFMLCCQGEYTKRGFGTHEVTASYSIRTIDSRCK